MTADTPRLVGRRVLVVGASAGIGRVIGETLCEAGAHVAFAARRKDVCEAAAKDAAGTAIGLECDVTDEAQCQRVVDEAVEGLGGLDDVVYTAGAISLIALADADADWWRRTFETNVMGAALVTKAALPHLQQSTGSMIYLSSVASVGAVWPGLGVYASDEGRAQPHDRGLAHGAPRGRVHAHPRRARPTRRAPAPSSTPAPSPTWRAGRRCRSSQVL